jgi:hypothetical protein
MTITIDGNQGISSNGSTFTFIPDDNGFPLTPNRPACLAYRSVAQSFLASTWTKINLDAVRYNTGGAFNVSNGRFTAPVTGLYLYSYTIHFEIGTSEYFYSGIQLNGTFYHYGFGLRLSGSWIGDNTLGHAHQIRMNAGDFIELWGYSTAANSFGPGLQRTSFAVSLIG